MQTLNFPALASSEIEVNPPLNVVIAYEDFESGKRAMKTYNYLLEQLGHECLFSNQMWKFDVLSVPKLRDMAAKDAASAQIIIIATHGDHDLPPQVKLWAESWLPKQERAIALVAIFDGLSEFDESPARDYLAGLAKRGKMEFFSQPGFWPGKTESPVESTWEQSDKTFSVLANVMQERHVSHWGINE